MATDDNVVSDLKDNEDNLERSTEEKAESQGDAKSDSSPESKSSDESSSGRKSTGSEDELAELQAKLDQAEKKAAENWEEVLRARADLENTRKRMQREVENAHKYAVEKFVQGLLPVIDSLEMGMAAAQQEDAQISALKEGTELTLKMFSDCAEKFGMQALDPKGEKFNPEFHQAMSIQESAEQDPDTVIAVMQKGYLLNGRLIRPAMVVVAKAASGSGEGAENNPKESEKSEKNS